MTFKKKRQKWQSRWFSNLPGHLSGRWWCHGTDMGPRGQTLIGGRGLSRLFLLAASPFLSTRRASASLAVDICRLRLGQRVGTAARFSRHSSIASFKLNRASLCWRFRRRSPFIHEMYHQFFFFFFKQLLYFSVDEQHQHISAKLRKKSCCSSAD